ncbi:MAG: alpha/beta hydrolase [Maritimibacter sp.]
MSKIKFSGPLLPRISSFSALMGIGLATTLRHKRGQKMAPDWDVNFEVGIRFWRRQFTKAMAMDMARGRVLFDSVQTETDEVYEVSAQPCETPKGVWYHPKTRRSGATLLYLHGGGYAFRGAMSTRFAQMLAHHIGAPLFAPHYRLTPEHSHPAQAEDALAAWRYVTREVDPAKVVVMGDSAGGHMALMLLQSLKAEGLSQPALCIGMCPWTDIGDRGASMTGNDPTDMVQGWMALKFGEWLDPNGTYGRAALSPIEHDYQDLAPIYLQAGGREVLRDMIRDFEQVQRAKGADVRLEEWADMPHDFQLYDGLKQASCEALARICEEIAKRV